jgi:N-acetylneuraminic acid mutarotase
MQLPNCSHRQLIGAAALACAAALIPASAFAAPPPASHQHAVLAAGQRPAGTWRRLPAAPGATFQFFTVSVWTGHEMIINTAPATFAYRPATNTWKKLARGPGALAYESTDIGVWTGSRMLVLGLANGAYNPATNTWRRLTTRAAPLQGAVVAWTGHQVLTWDGVCCAGISNEGESYTPATNTWQPLPVAPLKARRGARGAWTGKELVVAGGTSGPEAPSPRIYRDAAAYNPATRTWRKLPPMPARRPGGTAVWDGKEVLFVGGYRPAGTGFSLAAHGLAYNPVTNRWRWLPAMPFARAGFAAVWTGRQLLVWGGLTAAGVAPPHGEAYTPATNRWTALPASPLRGRPDPTAVWTGRRMIVWGGYNSAVNKTYTDGAAYTPATP